MKSAKRPTRFGSVGNSPDQCKKLRGTIIMAGASPFISARLIQAWTLWRGRRLPPFFSPGFNNQRCLVQYSLAKQHGSPTTWTPTDLLGISNHHSTVAPPLDCFQPTQLHTSKTGVSSILILWPNESKTEEICWPFPKFTYRLLAETLATRPYANNVMRIQWCACLNSSFTRYQGSRCIWTVW